MNKYLSNLNRIEFVVTLACTGRCKHCSEGDHRGAGEHIPPSLAGDIVRKIAGKYDIKSVMTFGGEPLLYPEVVYAVHSAASKMNIPKRQLITNGFFSNKEEKITEVAERLSSSGVNDLLLSVDAFHQETIPIEPVRLFAQSVKRSGVRIRTQPAWLVSKEDRNPYNARTEEVLSVFDQMGVERGSGNVIFPSGNALKYLGEYFEKDRVYENPYAEDPFDLKTVTVDPDGSALGGNVLDEDILDLLEGYRPE